MAATQRFRFICITALASVAAACDASTAPDLPVVASVEVSPAAAVVPVGGQQEMSAVPRDADGNPIAGVSVFWASENPDLASVSSTGVVTGLAPGGVRIAASAGGRSGTADMTIIPPPVASVSVDPPSATFRVRESIQLRATPRDAAGNPLPGRPVSWSSDDPEVAAVDGGGVVTARKPGAATITATSEGSSGSAAINVTAGPPAALAIFAGNGQTGGVGEALALALAVVVTDADGFRVGGATVAWSVSGGAISPASGPSGGDGVASATWTLPTTPGTYTAVATVSGVAPVGFTATARVGPPSSVTRISGDGQSATVGELLPQPLVVRVTDAFGNPVASVDVGWTTSAGGSFSPSTGRTDSDGRTSTRWTLGTGAGNQTARAQPAGSGAFANFTAQARPGPIDGLDVVAGNDQTGNAGETLPSPLRVLARDRFGNGIAGVLVSWIADKGGSLNPALQQTGADGTASTAWTLGTKGKNTAIALAEGFLARFEAQAK